MRAAEKAANASSSRLGSSNNASSRRSNAKAADQEAAATSRVGTALVRYTGNASNAAVSTRELASAHRASSAATDEHTRRSASLGGALGAVSSALGRVLPALTNQARRLRESTAASVRARKENFSLGQSVSRVGSLSGKAAGGVTRLSQAVGKLAGSKTQIGGLPVFALISGLTGLIALIGPAIAGLGAAGTAAFGFASSLASIGGAAIGAIPGLLSLISAVAAVKTAFGGIGGAFKALQQSQDASAKVGGGGGGGGSKKVELTQTEKIARAQEAYRRSVQDVTFAEDDLNTARKESIQNLKDLQTAVDRNAQSLKEARASSQLADENYANVMADPGSTKGEKMDAAAQVGGAKNDLQDTIKQNIKNVQDLTAAKKLGVSGDRSVIQANRAVTDSINAQRDAQLDLQNAYIGDDVAGAGAAAAAADAYAAALAKLSPSARSVVLQLIAMQGAWRRLQQTVQEAFFSEIVGDIQHLTKLFPPLTTLLSASATAMGKLTDKLLLKITSPVWIRDLGDFSKTAVPVITNLGDGLLSLLDAIRDLAFAAGPFMISISKGFQRATDRFADFVATGRKTGSIKQYLDRVLDTMQRWGRIIYNIVGTIVNLGSAARDFSKDITKGFEQITEGWLKSSRAQKQAGSPFKTYLDNIRPAVTEIRKFWGGLFSYLGKVASDPKVIKNFISISTLMRTKLGPALAKILDSLNNSNLGEKFIEVLSSLADAIAAILDNGGTEGIAAFYDILIKVADALDFLANALPPGVVKFLVASFLTLGLMKFLGIFKLLGYMKKLGVVFKNSKVGTAILSAFKRLGKFTFSNIGKLAKLGFGGLLAALGKVLSKLKDIAGIGFGKIKDLLGRGSSATAARGATGAAAAGAAGRRVGSSVAPRVGPTARMTGATYVDTVPTTRGAITGTTRAISGAPATRAVESTRASSTQVARVGSAVATRTPGRASIAGGTFRATPIGRAGVARVGSAARPGTDFSSSGGTRLIGSTVRAAETAGQDAKGVGKLLKGLSAAGKVAKGLGKGIGIGAVLSIAGSFAGDAISGKAAKGNKGATQRVGGSIVSGASTGAGIGASVGAAIGTPFFGVGAAPGAAIGGAVGGAVGGAASFFSQPKKDRETFIKETGNAIKDFFTKKIPQIVQGAPGAFVKGLKTLGGWLKDGWVNVKKYFQNLPYNIGYTVGYLWGKLQTFPSWVREMWGKAKDYVASLPKKIGDAAGNIWGKLKSLGGWFRDRWADFTGWASKMGRKIANAAGDIWAVIKNPGPWLAKKASDIKGWASKLPSRVSAWAGDIWKSITGVGPWLAGQLQKVKDWATSIPAAVGGWVGNIFGKVAAGATQGNKDAKKGRYNGGPIRRAGGGAVPGVRSNSDTVDAKLTPGEFVLRKAIVNRVGMENLARLNSGVMTYAQLLQQSMSSAQPNKDKTSKGSTDGMGVSYLNGGGLVPSISGRSGTASVSTATKGLASSMASQDNSTHYGDINIYNPKAEPASDSLPRTVRKLAYLGSIKTGK